MMPYDAFRAFTTPVGRPRARKAPRCPPWLPEWRLLFYIPWTPEGCPRAPEMLPRNHPKGVKSAFINTQCKYDIKLIISQRGNNKHDYKRTPFLLQYFYCCQGYRVTSFNLNTTRVCVVPLF